MSASLSHTAFPVTSPRSLKAVTGQRFQRARPGHGLLDIWWERAVARRQLAEMDAHMLMDIGISRPDAVLEAKKPFWVA